MNRWMVAGLLALTLYAGLSLSSFARTDKNVAPVVPPAAPVDADRLPHVVAADTEHEFGAMEVGDQGEHAFVIGNSGQADLQLTLRGTTCKCTLADLPDGRIPPGEERTVRLEWKAEQLTEHFRHGAILTTNDPSRPEVPLVVSGHVRQAMVVVPDDLVIIGRAEPHERNTYPVWIYSQIYNDLQIDRIESTHPYLSWEVEPIAAEDALNWKATAGQKLRITLEPGQPEGRFGGSLKVFCRVPSLPENKQPAPIDVPVHTQMRGKMRLFGPLLEEGRVLNLGQLMEGEGLTTTVFIALRGEHTDLTVRDLQVTPDFLDVSLTRDDGPSGIWTRYKLTVTVPRDAPSVDHLSLDPGEIRLVTDNAEVSEMVFRVVLGIAPPPK